MLASSLHDPDYVRLPAGTDVPDKAERRRLKASCRRFLSGHQPRSMKERLHDLAELAPDDLPDEYGAGEVIEALERRVAGLLGQERAVFVPKGVIAQQAALRVWSERANRRTLVVHPKSHLDLDEEAAYERLHPFRPIRRGSDGAPLAVADLQDVREPIFALTVELPLRRAGFRLPGWEELVGLAGWARERGAAFHLDGARLWEAQPFYGRELAEIAALADSVYVSFYKGLGGLAGCALAGPARFIAETSVWRTRHGASTTSRRRRPRGMPWARSRSATPRVTSAPARSSNSSPVWWVEGSGG